MARTSDLSCPAKASVKQYEPHPEEARSAVSKDGYAARTPGHPSRRAQERAPQDEVGNLLKRRRLLDRPPSRTMTPEILSVHAAGLIAGLLASLLISLTTPALALDTIRLG